MPAPQLESLEGGPQVHLHAAGRQLIVGFSKRTAGHIPGDSAEIRAIEEIEDLAFSFDSHLLREEPGDTRSILRTTN